MLEKTMTERTRLSDRPILADRGHACNAMHPRTLQLPMQLTGNCLLIMYAIAFMPCCSPPIRTLLPAHACA